jgi:hypothetical protein
METETTRRQLLPALRQPVAHEVHMATLRPQIHKHAMWRRLSICLEQVVLQVH